jgi:hypothetical protein
MTRHAIRTSALLLALAFLAALRSEEPAATSKFPAVIQIVETEPESPTRFTVRLKAEHGIDIYANSPQNAFWEHVAARLTIRDADNASVDVRVEYPSGTKIDSGFVGDLYVYRNSVDMAVVVARDTIKRPLSVIFEGAGYDRLRTFCLGKIKLETVRI